MDDLNRRIDALSGRLRLQTLITFGALAVLVFAMGGADAIARGLVEADAWTIRTKKLDGTLTDRLVATTDVDTAQLKLKTANLVLEKQATQPFAPATSNEGALWYDSTSRLLKVSNGSSWSEPGGGLILISKITVAAVTTSVSFAGLDGDQHGTYFLSMRIKSASGQGNDLYRMKPNGVATEQCSKYWCFASNNTVVCSSDALMYLNRSSAPGANGTYAITAWFNARRTSGGISLQRTYVSDHTRTSATGSVYETGGAGGAWNNTSSLLTSLMIDSYWSNGIGVGSEFYLYRLQGS